MKPDEFLLALMLILLTARIFSELAARMKITPVIGELFAGIVLGPSLLGLVEPVEAIRLMAEIGIIMLLFEVGLETDIHKLIASGAKSTLVAISGFVLPFVFGYLMAHFVFDLSNLVSLFIGGTLTATSIGITVRVLCDLNCQHGKEGQIVLGAAVLDDVLGVLLLAMLYEFSVGGGISLTNVGKVATFITAFFLLAPLAAKFMSQLIKRFHEKSESPGLVPSMVVVLILFFAWLAHILGAPEILGGFAAGLALSRRFFFPFGAALHRDTAFAKSVEHQLKPIISLFTPLFFVMVGLSLNFHQIDWSSGFIWLFSLAFLIVAVIGKMAMPLLLDHHRASNLMIGLAMVPRGEVGLIFAELGRETGIINNEIYAGMIIVIALTTIVPPFFMKALYNRHPDEFPVMPGDTSCHKKKKQA
jgi:Kef-type K+ transport system membrane component KefB